MVSLIPRPILIIGAARSGTKLLRTLIASHPDVACVPYDVNFVWRIGNEGIEHDELDPEMLSVNTARRIRRRLFRFQSCEPALVEKTVSNCLRVPFVFSVFPQARILHLVRDGRDAVESALRQWEHPVEWRYAIRKAYAFPLFSVRRYGLRYAKETWRGKRGRVGQRTWGPRYRGIDEDLATLGIVPTVSRQWALSVEKTMAGLRLVPQDQILTIRYEDLVESPIGQMENVYKFAKVDPAKMPNQPCIQVNRGGIGRHQALSDETMELAMKHIRGPCAELGYI